MAIAHTAVDKNNNNDGNIAIPEKKDARKS